MNKKKGKIKIKTIKDGKEQVTEIKVKDNKLKENAVLIKELPKSEGKTEISVSGMELSGNSCLFDFSKFNDNE